MVFLQVLFLGREYIFTFEIVCNSSVTLLAPRNEVLVNIRMYRSVAVDAGVSVNSPQRTCTHMFLRGPNSPSAAQGMDFCEINKFCEWIVVNL